MPRTVKCVEIVITPRSIIIRQAGINRGSRVAKINLKKKRIASLDPQSVSLIKIEYFHPVCSKPRMTQKQFEEFKRVNQIWRDTYT